MTCSDSGCTSDQLRDTLFHNDHSSPKFLPFLLESGSGSLMKDSAVWTRSACAPNPHNDLGLPPTHPSSKNSHCSYSQQPCVVVWFLRKLEIYSPRLCSCQWKYQIWFHQELLLEVVSMDSTYEKISEEALLEIPNICMWGRRLDSVRFQQSLSALLLWLIKFKTLDSDQ